jgi:hypothetical protein
VHRKKKESATIRTRKIKPGLCEVVYAGDIDRDDFIYLQPAVMRAFGSTMAAVKRLDLGVVAIPTKPPISGWEVRPGMVVMVVAAGQLEMWWEYARDLAQIGVRRAVFSSEQFASAYRFAESVSLAKKTVLPVRLLPKP